MNKRNKKIEDDRFLTTILENLPHMVFVKEVNELRFTLFNKAGEDLLGVKNSDLLGKNDYDFFPKEQADFFTTKDREVLASKKMLDIPEEAIQTPKGTRYLHTKKIPILDSKGNATHLLGISMDITEKRELLHINAEQSERLNKIVNSIPVILSFFDDQGNLEWVNNEWNKTIGYRLTDLYRKNFFNILFENPPKKVTDLFETSPRKWKEVKTKTKSGSQLSVLWHATKTSSGSWIGIARDITEEKMLHQEVEQKKSQMIHSSRLNQLGEMAGGIAHEINNPLTVILGYSNQIQSLAKKNELNPERINEITNKISKTVDRISGIIRGLRNFAREGSHDPFVSTSIGGLLKETIELAQGRLKKFGIEIKLDQNLKDTAAEIRSIQVSQVILNLISNSIDAIENLDEKWIELKALDLGDSVEISITDSGTGITEEVANNIMNPFFTTKELGKGTGLGLSISLGIIQNHCGELKYDPESKNTRFFVRIPKQQPKSVAQAA